MALQQRKPIAASRRIAIVAADAGRLIEMRGPLMRQIAAQGHKILCVTAGASEAALAEIAELGARHEPFVLTPGPLKLLTGRPATRALSATLAAWQPSVVLGIGGKAMQMAALAARPSAGARVVLIASSIEAMSADSARAPLGRRWIVARVLAAADAIVAHNAADAARLAELGGSTARAKVHLLPGAGVDLSRFQPIPLPSAAGGLVFGMIAQPLAAKGVREFLEAARLVRTSAPKTRFLLARVASSGEIADTSGFDDAVEVADAPADRRAVIGQCHVVVLPSRGQGFAQEIAEALACGRPAITTNVAGCKETVDERVSGVLVPPADVSALAGAMESFVRRPEQLGWMAQAARLKAERRFDASAVNVRLMELLDLSKRSEKS